LAIALANIWSMEALQTVGMGEAGVMDAATAADERKFLKVNGGE
jgi:type IV secretion system protein VirB5